MGYADFILQAARVPPATLANPATVPVETAQSVAALATVAGPRSETGTVAAWRIGISQLSPDRPPCPSFRRWPAVHRACRRFLEDHAERADGLDWSTTEIFGVHPVAGTIRLDCTGALMVGDGAIVAEIERDVIRFDNGLAFRRQAHAPEASISVWEFRR